MLLAPSASPFEICGYLLRCCEKINPQRIKDTPAVNFLSRLGYTSPISKGLRKMCFQKRWRCVHLLRAAQNKYSTFQKRHGCRWFHSEASLFTNS